MTEGTIQIQGTRTKEHIDEEDGRHQRGRVKELKNAAREGGCFGIPTLFGCNLFILLVPARCKHGRVHALYRECIILPWQRNANYNIVIAHAAGFQTGPLSMRRGLEGPNSYPAKAETYRETESRRVHPPLQYGLTSSDVPQWLVFDSITVGYRMGGDYRSCLWSLFRLHNECLNAWTMIWISAFSVCGLVYVLNFVHPSAKRMFARWPESTADCCNAASTFRICVFSETTQPGFVHKARYSFLLEGNMHICA